MSSGPSPAAPRAQSEPKSRSLQISLIVLALIAVRLVAAALTDLVPDEIYYLQWSRYPAASYYDHPPMVAWWIAASTWLLGDSLLGIRFVHAMSLIPSTFAIYLTGRVLFGRASGERAALWVHAIFLVSVGLQATPDAPSVLFWSLTVLAFALVVVRGHGAWWLLVGLFAGLGVLSKLTGLFLGLGIVATLIVLPDQRRWLWSPWLWAGGVIAAIVIAPMILWNIDHDWITFTKQMGRITRGGFQPLKFPEFIATQFAVLNPLVAMFAGLAVIAWWRRLPAYSGPGLALLCWTTIPLVAYMTFYSFQQQIQGNWLAPIVVAVAVAAAAAGERATDVRWAKLRDITFPVGVGGMLIGLVVAANPGGFVPDALDAGRIGRGWQEVAAKVEALAVQHNATWIATTHYSRGAAIDYYIRDPATPVVPVMQRRRFDFAPPPPDSLLTAPVLIVGGKDSPAYFTSCFEEIERVGTIDRRNGSRVIQTIPVFSAQKAHRELFTIGCDQLRRNDDG
jgi:4-amino-4-deoxy-L-arabinose transferase-like glycosyltransferase